MSEVGQTPNEQRFEEYITAHLIAIGFRSINNHQYDKERCLIPDEFLSFIQGSQADEYQKLTAQFSSKVDDTILMKLSDCIGKHGLIHTLRKGLSTRGVHLHTFVKQPRSALNPQHQVLYQKNRLAIVRQLRFSPHTEQSVDICLFLNGLPLLTIELKNQLTRQNIKDAEAQYRHDRDPKEKLFHFKRCFVHFAADNNAVSMTTKLSGDSTWFLPYNKGILNPDTGGYKSEYLWREILTPDSLLDIIENFVHLYAKEETFFNTHSQEIETKKSTVLIFPRYHQLDVVRKLREQVKKEGVGHNYLIQHATGSGKSFEIGWLAHSLTSLYQHDTDPKRMFDTTIVITDRNVLDRQLQNTIKSLEQTPGIVHPVDGSSAQLKRYLESGKALIITTIQKFPFIADTIPSLGDRKFAVIIDEVHSSQSGELSKDLKKALAKFNVDVENEDDWDYEDYIREEIKSRGRQAHISFFGFTGTPKEKTLELFGTKHGDGKFYPFHSYTMRQSIHEGFTLDVLQNYTTFKRYFRVKEKSDEDIKVPSSRGSRELIRFVDSHPRTIQQKVGIMLDHFIKHGSKEIQGKGRGMIVVRLRRDCVKYFHEVNKQLEERKKPYRSLVGFSSEIDGATEVSLNKTIGHKGDIPLGLKNPKYRLLIVSNKFQTGFDEPLVQSMYVDKKLGGVQCAQTLSRLNRKCSGKNKTFVLDFVNEMAEVVKSFRRYYTTTLLTEETDPDRLYEYQIEINSYNLFTADNVEAFCKIFYDKNRDDSELQPILEQSVQLYLRIEEEGKQDDFKSLIQSFMRLYSYISQIMRFTDEGIEKLFIFLSYLNKKLPKKSVDELDISDSVDLGSLRIEKTSGSGGKLEGENIGELEPYDFGVRRPTEDEEEPLSELIKSINERFGNNLTEEDKLDIGNLNKRVIEDEELTKIMKGDSSETNKKEYFDETIKKIILSSYTDHECDFYEKMERPEMKNVVINSLYESYNKQSL